LYRKLIKMISNSYLKSPIPGHTLVVRIL
ncbi:hypothetical protein GCK32_017769, partial [Trichostrongylus colubriformis]